MPFQREWGKMQSIWRRILERSDGEKWTKLPAQIALAIDIIEDD